ncbi:hypothetical protein Hamer_G012229 [Homarus americanus]|uniref:SWIM-type domain-containing protein n=1 Tax=Homarus americanus TaxID=6706 RepID=A0A8J5K6Y8_HOMAM|nr:hypothetical protein Hamer_G012229 [Homarus americanus]
MEQLREDKKSICYMSLADAFLTRLRKEAETRTRRRILKGVGVDVLPVTMDRQDFIYDYLTKLYDQKKGTFSKPKIFAKQTIYECERSNVCKGSSSGDPTKTRANGCNAYVSFMFEEGATITACIVRFRLLHNGHDPTNREESRISRIDMSLKVMIEMQINSGMKISEIMNEIAKWNKMNKNTDHKNRRYFPTRQDIQQLALSLKKPLKIPHSSIVESKKPRKYDTMNKDNITRLLRTELRETCVYYQSQTITGTNPRPLIVVLQNSDMREMCIRHGQHFVHIEKNYEGLRQYGNAVYVLVVRDDNGNGFPIAYIITSDDDGVTFVQALQKLTSRCQITPRAFFLDREIHNFSEMMAPIYPESHFFISWCQVAQEVHKWLQGSAVSGKEHADVRKVLLHYILELKGYDMEEDFMLAASEMQHRIDFETFTAMLQAEWMTCAANFVGGMVNMSLLLEGTASEQAGLLLNQGWSQLITWQGQWVAHVPCHNVLEMTYRVNLITMECECPIVTYVGPCLHLCLVMALAQLRDGPTSEQERHRLASEAYENSDYVMDHISCITFHSGVLCVTKLQNWKCTCIASTFDIDCVGKILLKIAEGREEAVTYTVPAPNTSPSPGLSHSPRDLVKDVDNSNITVCKAEVVPAFTITMTSQVEKSSAQDGTFQGIQEQPMIIQVHTGLVTDPSGVSQMVSARGSEMSDSNLESVKVIKKEIDQISTDTNLSSLAIIEKLYQWSRSKDFKDSKVLNDMLRETHNVIWGKQNSSLLKQEVEPKTKKIKDLGNKKLRAVVQSVKRPRVFTEDDDDGLDQMSSVLPTMRVSRSGRTIKIKEEPDFIM